MNTTLAQNNPTKDFTISAQGHYGLIMSHRHNMAQLIKGHIRGAELSYSFQTTGNKPWQQLHNYPEIGFCILHMDLANPKQLGTIEAIYPYTNLRLNRLNQKVNLNLRLGTGLGYLTKPFDRITNHKNNTIGSYVNCFINIRLSASIPLSSAWKLNTGIGLTHISNGAFKTPNLGLNMATVNMGIAYVFGNRNLTYKADSIAPYNKHWKYSIIAVTGIKELSIPDEPKYMVYGIQAIAYKPLNYKNKIGGGIEFNYNNAIRTDWEKINVYNPSFLDIVQAGIKFTYSYSISRLSLPVEFGVYIFKRQPDKSDGMYFHRIGFRYLINKHLIANLTLYTHFAKADHFEGGIGYEF